jgi:hypothetical protein
MSQRLNQNSEQKCLKFFNTVVLIKHETVVI